MQVGHRIKMTLLLEKLTVGFVVYLRAASVKGCVLLWFSKSC